MVTKARAIKNCFLINAPAGSGKTTRIENMVLNILGDNKNSNILCITYTNRAAEELIGRLDSDKVQISTIHSFINQFINVYFYHREIIDLYFEIFGDKIKERIENTGNNRNVEESNKRYEEKFGSLNFTSVKNNIKNLSYNEMQYTSLYSGGLSHDDLLEFTYIVMSRFEKINKRISQKYDYIFIDEYQDTSADVLRLFFNAVKGNRTKLYLFGDKMQQIYKSYDGSFEAELTRFDSSEKLNTNYRSSISIVDVLNNIYNDPSFKQCPSEKAVVGNQPVVYILDNAGKFLEQYHLKNPDILKLVVFNRIRFESIGAGGLFEAYNQMERYSFGRKNSASEVLTKEIDENPDDVFKTLLFWQEIYDLFNNKKYGLVIQKKKSTLIDKEEFSVVWHSDKLNLYTRLNMLFTYYEESDANSIGDWLIEIKKSGFLNKTFADNYIDNEEYIDVFDVSLEEFKHLYANLKSPTISTQHGVKGEGHDKVIFIADNAPNLSVKMYDFFELWSRNDVVFTDIQKFYFQFKQKIEELQRLFPTKLNALKAPIYNDHKEVISDHISGIYDEFKDNTYFKELYVEHYNSYFESKNVTRMKDCIKISEISGVLNAYKLFYVGCSRAKKELSVLIDREEVVSFESELKKKFKECGFQIG